MTRYRTIVADPPWEYPEGFAGYNNGAAYSRGDQEGRGPVRLRSLPYPSMTHAQIRSLAIADLCDQSGGNLFLWTTNRHLPAAIGILDAWGAVYRQLVVWQKTGANPLSGSIATNSAEFLLYARIRRGAPLSGKWPGAVLTHNRLGNRHSAKPEMFLDLVEQVSPGPYLEMFSRRARFGWDVWGDEALDPIAMPTTGGA